MKVALTGATGFIGSHVLTDLYKHGHDVTALVRNDDQADIVAARGATPTVVDLYDRAAVVASWVMRTERSTQPVLVTPPAPTRLRSCRRTIDAYAGTGKPFIEISGLWIYGANTSITEESPFRAPSLVAWKEPIERRVLAVNDRRGVVVVSGVAYGERRRDARATARLAPRRPGQLDHARHRATALVDSPRGRPCRLLPPRIGT
jgi:NAD(P)H-binding